MQTIHDFLDTPKNFEHVGRDTEKDDVFITTVKHKVSGDVYYYNEYPQYKSLAEQLDDIGEYCCGWHHFRRH